MISMKKYILICTAGFILAGCSTPPHLSAEAPAGSQWFQAGYQDASTGKIVKDNNTLAEWYGNPQINREEYLQGYSAGQKALCQPAALLAWGKQGKNFPASCDGVDNAERLRDQWQQKVDPAGQ